MNGKKAKALRKLVYGEWNLRVDRDYSQSEQRLKDGSANTTTIINHPDSLRAKYQTAKREWTR